MTPHVETRHAEKEGRTFGEKFKRGFASGAGGLGSVVGSLAGGLKLAQGAAGGLVRHIGVVATSLTLASRITRGFAISLGAASLGLKYVAGISLAKLGVGLGIAGKLAGKLSTQITRVTSALLVLAAVGKVLSTMNRFAKLASMATIGVSVLIGVVTALASVLGQALVGALMTAGAAVGVFAGAAVGLLGPALGVLKLGIKGLGDGAKAFADTMKDAWGPADEAFNKMIGQRMGPLLTQFRELRMAVTDTFSQALVPAFGSLTGLMAGLQPRFTQLATTLGGIGSKIAGALASPETSAALDKMFAASDQFVGSLGPGLANVVSGLVQFAGTAADTFKGAGVGISDLLTKFGDWLRGISPAQMIGAFAALRAMVSNVWSVLKPILVGIREIGSVSAPALAPGIKALGGAIAAAVPGLVKMSEILMPALSQVMERIAPVIPELVRAFTPWAGVLATIAPPIASMVANLAPLAPLLLVTVAGVKAIGIAMVAYNAAMLLAANATKIARTAWFLFNAAFIASPIGLIVVAVAALAAGLWAFFTKTETGRVIWEKLWTGIKQTVSTVWNWLKTTLATAWTQIGPSVMKIGEVAKQAFGTFVGAVKTVWTAIQPAIAWIGRLWMSVAKLQFGVAIAALKALGAVIGWLWSNVVVPAFSGIASAISTWWAGVQAVWGLAKSAIQTVGDVIMWLWNTVAVPAFSAIGSVISTWWSGVQAVWDMFKTGVDTVGNAIGTLKDAFTTGFNAIKGVVESVWNFISGIFDKIGNGIGNVVDKLRSIPGIGSLIPGNADGRAPGFAGGSAGVSTSGVVSGPGTGTSDSILARISAGEGIVKTSAMQNGGGVLVAALNAGWTPTADQLHQMFPGFAEGLNPGADWLRTQIMQTYPQISTIGGKGSEDGYGEHSSGNAIDIMIPDYSGAGKQTGDQIASWIAKNRDAIGADGMIWRQTSFGYGGDWSTGKQMADRGSDTQNHMDHVHVILGKGRGAGAAKVDAPASSLSMSGASGSSSSSSLGSATSAGGGAYKPATDKQLAAGQSKVDSAGRAVTQAGQRVDDATYARDKAAKRLEELRAGGKDTADAQHALDVKNRELADATDAQTRAKEKATAAENDFATLQSKGVEDASAAKDSAGGSGGVGDLGKSLWSGLLETIGLDGSLFSNPFEWPTVKSIMAGINVLGGTLSGSAGADGSGGDPSGFLGAVAESTGLGDMLTGLNPGAMDIAAAPVNNVAPDTTQHGAGQGQAPGPGVYIENAGMDPKALSDRLTQEQNARTRTTTTVG